MGQKPQKLQSSVVAGKDKKVFIVTIWSPTEAHPAVAFAREMRKKDMRRLQKQIKAALGQK